jgi:hypothetical protein
MGADNAKTPCQARTNPSRSTTAILIGRNLIQRWVALNGQSLRRLPHSMLRGNISFVGFQRKFVSCRKTSGRFSS